MKFVQWMDNNPKLLKVILALPFLEIVWVIYRLVKSLAKKDMLGVVVAVLLLVFGWAFLWLVDIITIVLWDKVIWFD